MFFVAKLPRMKWIVVSLLAVLLGFFLLKGCHAPTGSKELPRAANNDERIAYLSSLGYTVLPDPIETLSLTLSDPLQEPYLSYNDLQLSQGFDLRAVCGQPLTRYTYVVTNYPEHAEDCQADLYVCEGRVVAGDIVCTGKDGFLTTLPYPQ